MASPKLVTPPPANIQAKQPMRLTARVALFTAAPQDGFINGMKVNGTKAYLKSKIILKKKKHRDDLCKKKKNLLSFSVHDLFQWKPKHTVHFSVGIRRTCSERLTSNTNGKNSEHQHRVWIPAQVCGTQTPAKRHVRKYFSQWKCGNRPNHVNLCLDDAYFYFNDFLQLL